MSQHYNSSKSNARNKRSLLNEACAELVLREIRRKGGSLVVHKETDAPNARGPGGITRAQFDAALERLVDRGAIRLGSREIECGCGNTLAMVAHVERVSIEGGEKGTG